MMPDVNYYLYTIILYIDNEQMSILVRINEKINLNILKQNRLYIPNMRALYDIQLH